MQTIYKFDKSLLTPVVPLNGDEIKTIRKDLKLTQPEFAKLCGVTHFQVSNWERGTKKPSGPALKLITLIKNGLNLFVMETGNGY